jgi:hypothetical protein
MDEVQRRFSRVDAAQKWNDLYSRDTSVLEEVNFRGRCDLAVNEIARHITPGGREIAIGESFVNHGIMCGNLTAAVAYFAMLEGLLPGRAPLSEVRMLCRNTGKTIVCRLPAREPGVDSGADGSKTKEREATPCCFSTASTDS